MPLTDRKRALCTVARERIAQGNLPGTVPKSLGAGWGTGATCGLCDCTIERGQVGYEFTGPSRVTFHFDMQCHAIWQLAAAARIDGPVPS
jgi:hypothetical protein